MAGGRQGGAELRCGVLVRSSVGAPFGCHTSGHFERCIFYLVAPATVSLGLLGRHQPPARGNKDAPSATVPSHAAAAAQQLAGHRDRGVRTYGLLRTPFAVGTEVAIVDHQTLGDGAIDEEER